MKKAILILGVALSILACNKEESNPKEFKTAYINTSELIDKYDKFKDEDDKFKVKSEELGRPLEAKVKAFQSEAQSFQQNAQAKGPQWAQQKGAELQQREQQLGMEQNALLQQLQKEGAVLKDTLINEVKKLDKDKTYFVYCRSGNRSSKSISIMKNYGIKDIYDLKGGIINSTELLK